MSNPLDKYLGGETLEKPSPLAEKIVSSLASPVVEDDGEPDNPVYGSDRTRRQKNMLSFRKANNTRRHIPYPHILMVDDSEGLIVTVYSHGCIVTIEGKNLDLIANRIKQGTLSYIQESNKQNPVYSPDGVAVFSISYDMQDE